LYRTVQEYMTRIPSSREMQSFIQQLAVQGEIADAGGI